MTSDELRAFRAGHDLTRAQVAALVGVARGTVRNWEQSVSAMPEPAAFALRRATRAQIERVKREHPVTRRRAAQPDQGATDAE